MGPPGMRPSFGRTTCSRPGLRSRRFPTVNLKIEVKIPDLRPRPPAPRSVKVDAESGHWLPSRSRLGMPSTTWARRRGSLAPNQGSFILAVFPHFQNRSSAENKERETEGERAWKANANKKSRW